MAKFKKATTLKSMRISEISLVDNPACPGANVLLAKRGEAEPYWKRTFTQVQRDAATASGHAMAGGGYPINDVKDLHDAIQAIGRAKDPSATKAHIKTQAARLGRSDLIPDTWAKRKDGDLHVIRVLKAAGVRFDKKVAHEGLPVQEIASAVADFSKALACISKNEDIAVNDTAKAYLNQYEIFKAHIVTLVSDDVVKAMRLAGALAAGRSVDTITKGYTNMATVSTDVAELQKKLVKRDAKIEKFTADTALLTGQVADLTKQVKILKMSSSDQEYRATLTKDDADAFDNMSDEDKAKKKAAQPIDKNLPPHIQLIMKQNAEMVAQLAKADEAAIVATFAKKAADLGQPVAFGETLRKAYGGDAVSQLAVETIIKGLLAQVNQGALFKNFGTTHGAAGTASAEVEVIAKGLLDTGKVRSIQSGIAKVAEMPEHADLWKRYKAEGVAPAVN